MRNPALVQKGISLKEHRQQVCDALLPHRLEILVSSRAWIERAEGWIRDYMTCGAEIDIVRISPYLELCVTQRQHDTWRYFRLWSVIPYNRGCGRLLRYLLRDAGQPGHPVMGVASLMSPILICQPRDEWIGWEYPRDKELKRKKLLSCMDLSVCMAVSPYNLLTAGKMAALAMVSKQIQQDYADKYRDHVTPTGMSENRLALVTTTSLYGSSVQYNRVRVNGRLTYKMVGYTEGYGNAHLTEREFADMEQYLRQIGKPIPKGWGTGRSYRLRVYTAYYRERHGLPQAPNHRQPRSVYVAPLGKRTREFLRGKTDDFEPFDYELDHLAIAWKQKWLSRRLDNPELIARFRQADPTTNLLSCQIDRLLGKTDD
jgi:hypothetical protein